VRCTYQVRCTCSAEMHMHRTNDAPHHRKMHVFNELSMSDDMDTPATYLPQLDPDPVWPQVCGRRASTRQTMPGKNRLVTGLTS
jgi:hypothetical protein